VVMASFEADKFEASAGFFNGATTVIGEDDSIDNYFASVTVNVMEGVKVGGSYISDITDTDLEIVGPNPVDTVAGYSVFAEVVYAGVVLNLEYLAASQFDVADLDLDNGGVGDGTGDAPATYNVEVGYELSDKVTVAARYEGSSEFFGFQETQYGVAGSYALYDNVGLTAEFISGENYLGEENSGFGAQLAIEF
ncbi:MAG: hypothetical protein KAR06_05260, partial [Deltaproteobacteria bacterium]|nr:hypothetical protein [Deltaproteobacteria bacterium]